MTVQVAALGLGAVGARQAVELRTCTCTSWIDLYDPRPLQSRSVCFAIVGRNSFTLRTYKAGTSCPGYWSGVV